MKCTTERLGPDHPLWIKDRGDFTQVIVRDENNHIIAHFFGWQAKLNAAGFVRTLSESDVNFLS